MEKRLVSWLMMATLLLLLLRAVALVNITEHTREPCIHFVLHWCCCCCCCRYPADISPSPSSLVLTWNRREHQQNRKYNRSRRLPPSSLSLHRWHINLVVSRNIQQQPAIWPSQFSAHLPLPSTWLMLKNTLGALLNAIQLNCTQLRAFLFFQISRGFWWNGKYSVK